MLRNGRMQKIESWREHDSLDSPHYFPLKAKYALLFYWFQGFGLLYTFIWAIHHDMQLLKCVLWKNMFRRVLIWKPTVFYICLSWYSIKKCVNYHKTSYLFYSKLALLGQAQHIGLLWLNYIYLMGGNFVLQFLYFLYHTPQCCGTAFFTLAFA